MATTLPALGGSFSSSKPRKDDTDDHSAAVNSMCKTLNATVTKLLFSYAAIQAEDNPSEGKASIALALAASKREELSSKIIETLTNSVEKVVRCKDASMRSHVIRDLRARFQPPPEKPKPIMVDEAVQCVVKTKQPRVSLASAATAVIACGSPPVRPAAPEAGPSDDEILRQLRGEEPAAAAAANEEAKSPSAAGVAQALTEQQQQQQGGRRDGASTRGQRPVSAAATSERPPSAAALPGIYERQMKWAAKAAERKEQMRVDKENKEKEAERPKERKESKQWAHVESVMRKQRVAAEDGWKSEWNEQMQAERERRERAEQKALEEQQRAHKLVAEKELAETRRKDAEERMDKYHQRAVKAEGRYEEAKKAQQKLAQQHAEELEIRDAFGEGGLEVWPMFPGRKVHRVLDSDEFDGRVSQEFRTKDAESGERGVTLLMGRLASGKTAEAQAVLFETERMTDLEAARWMQRNSHRFEQTRERVAREKERAASAKGRSRDRPELS